jgi:hypothetical protein
LIGSQALEKFNLPYTGAHSGFYEPSKELMKMVAYYQGVRAPAFIFAYDDDGVRRFRFYISLLRSRFCF